MTIKRQDCPLPRPWSALGDYPVLIYGAGDTGRKVAAVLRARNCKIVGFLDANAQPGQCLENVPLTTLEHWVSQNDCSQYDVVIAISNPVYLDQIPALRHRIEQHGFHQCIFDIYEIALALNPQDMVASTVKQRKALYAASRVELERLDSLLADEKSRLCLADAVLAWSRGIPMQYVEANAYRPHALPVWKQPLRLIDCGAFTGDTLADFSQNGYCFEAIAAFEPDPENFRRLVHNTARYEHILRFPCALGKQTTRIDFNACGNMGSHASIAGGEGGENCTVQCVTLDDVLPTFAPNLIKMDIEGAEPEALQGAKQLISKYRPDLAICLYHHPDHLWRIPFLLNEWKLGYHFYIREHHPVYDLVLYAYPGENV